MRFAELVFHVLAHVRATAHLAPSVYDRAYVDFVARHAPRRRTLHDDAATLGALAGTHDALVRVQLLAWVFDDVARADACRERTLDQLAPVDVDDAEALERVRERDVAAAEILRAAAELEADVVAALPQPTLAPQELARAVAALHGVAPLSRFTVTSVRSLRLRGRVRGDAIWVGAPCDDLGPTVEHAAWQAAHEATVAEVSGGLRRTKAPTHDDVESAALRRLEERARAAGLAAPHARWRAHFG